MQAMIFAAGMGTRLKPLTDVIPKALVPVCGKPLLQQVLERVQDAGATDVTINVHHHAQQIRNFLAVSRRHWNMNICISDETQQLLETGGAIRKAAHLFSDYPVLIHNVDILSNVNLREFYDMASDADALLLVSERKTKRYLVFDNDMRLIGWKNIETGEVKGSGNGRLLAFSGIHAIGKQLVEDMQTWPDKFPIIDFYLDRCLERNIRGYLKSDLRLLDVGKLDTLEQANTFINTL